MIIHARNVIHVRNDYSCAKRQQCKSWHKTLAGGESGLTLSLLRVINVNIPLQPHKKYDITQYGELAFHSLLKGWENTLFELRSERVKGKGSQLQVLDIKQ